jgi:hypothetical protein
MFCGGRLDDQRSNVDMQLEEAKRLIGVKPEQPGKQPGTTEQPGTDHV